MTAYADMIAAEQTLADVAERAIAKIGGIDGLTASTMMAFLSRHGSDPVCRSAFEHAADEVRHAFRAATAARAEAKAGF